MSTATIEPISDYELDRGKPMPSYNHSIIQVNLGAEFRKNRKFHVGSEMKIDLGFDQPMTPDILVFPRRSLELWNDVAVTTEAPLLVVEILSASQTLDHLVRRAQTYLAHGVQSCWLVAPPLHLISIHTADGREATYTEDVATDPVTGLTADLAAVFS